MTHSSSPRAGRSRALRLLKGGLLALALSLASGGLAQAQCLGGGEARQAVASGAALPLGSIVAGIGGQVVRAELCRRGGGLVYVLSVLDGAQVRTVVIDARSGARLR